MSTATEIYTYLVQPGVTTVLRQAQVDEWLEVVLRLETVGPVAIGHLQNLLPTTGGAGRLLPPGVDITVKLSPGSRLYVASETSNNISVQVNAIPGLEQVLRMIGIAAQPTQPVVRPSEGVDIGKFGFPKIGKR